MNAHYLPRQFLPAVAALALVGCGIDQGGNSNPPPQGASASTLLVSGPITGFGSVLVNDRTIDIANATTLVDGNPGIETDLRRGQMIRLVAQVEGNSVTARFLEFQRNLSGPVESVDAPAGRLTVLSQPVRTDASTVFDIPGVTRLVDLQVGEPVLVSGIPTAAGELLATYIGAADPADPLEISARITAVDTSALSFELGALTVDYSQTVLLDLPLGTPQVGQPVQVKGTTLNGSVLVAEQVRALPRVPGAFSAAANQLSNDELVAVGPNAANEPLTVSFEGVVSSDLVPNGFGVDDVDVQIVGDTVLTGALPGDPLAGRRIRVDGVAIDANTVEATRITAF